MLALWKNELDAADDMLVFPGETTSGYLDPTAVLRRELYPAMKRAGIPRIGPTGEKRTFHSFRHTFAKRALENGRRITWLSRHLGHSSLKVTTDVYGHWYPDGVRLVHNFPPGPADDPGRTRQLGDGGFRAWITDEPNPNEQRCYCGWLDGREHWRPQASRR